MRLDKDLENAFRGALVAGDGDAPKMSDVLRLVAGQKRFIPALAESLGVNPRVLRESFHDLASALDRFEAAPKKGSPAKKEAAPPEAASPASGDADPWLGTPEPASSGKKGAGEPVVSRAWASEEIAEAKLFTDGCSKGNPGKAAGGVSIQSPSGEPLFEAALEDFPDMTNNEAEYRALIRGLEIAKGKGIQRLSVFSDSELIVKQVTGKYRVKTPHLIPLADRAKELKASFRKCVVTAVPRAQNSRADELANLAIDRRARKAKSRA